MILVRYDNSKAIAEAERAERDRAYMDRVSNTTRKVSGDDLLKAYDLARAGASRADIVRQTSLTAVQADEIVKRARK